MLTPKVKLFLLIFIVIGIFGALSIYIVTPKVKPVINNPSIYWSSEWQQLGKQTVKKQTTVSGSEMDFDFIGVREFAITGATTRTDDDTSVLVYIDKKGALLKVDDLKKGKVIQGTLDNKKHSFRLIFYCRGYNSCNFTLTNLTATGGKILQPSGPMKTLGVLGDSISLLYAQDNYSSILSKNISYHLHNASVWGRDLSHAGKTAPAVGLFGKSLLPYKPNIVLISLGTNDVLDSVNEEDFINDFKKIIDKTAATLPNAKIVVLSILPGKTHQLEKTTKQWNTDMQQVLSDNMYFVDATNLLVPADYLDAIHPNVSGQEKIANFLTKYLVAHKLL